MPKKVAGNARITTKRVADVASYNKPKALAQRG
jgi:hypothetical protein